MFVLEYKVRQPKPNQVQSIEEAIRTTQFVRNKVLRFWMDNYDVGKTELFRYNTQLRAEYPFVKELNSHACQTAVERSLKAINRFFDNCRKKICGKKGYPRFAKNTRSVEYKVSGWKLSSCYKRITFTDKKGIGELKLIGTRDLGYFQPEQIKRVRIVRRSDGYYVQFSVKLDPRDTVPRLKPTQKCCGVDVGLKYFLAQSDGTIEPIPQFYRKREKQLNRLNRQKSRKFRKGKPQSQNYRKARMRYAKKHLDISRQREEYLKKVALRLVKSQDLIAYENLNVKGLIKNRRLAKSIADAGWSKFRHWLEYFAYKYGKIAIAVSPYNTSQECSNCGEIVKKTLSTRTHVCYHCGFVADRDVNAAMVILQRGLSTLGHSGTNAWGEDTAVLAEAILSKQVTSTNQESSRLTAEECQDNIHIIKSY